MKYKYKITLEYDGTSYRGWQMQKNARSIQDTLTEAAEKLFRHKVDIQGAGRTDAGVHALAQTAHLDTMTEMPPQKIMEGLNDLLPSNINILHVEAVPVSFHARHYAEARSYIYIISRHRTAFRKRYVWWVRDPLNIEEMRSACTLFTGFHDFSSFADKRLDKDASTKVKLDAVDIWEEGDLIVLRFVGSHFLWKMVRRMVGVLVEVGRENLSQRDVKRMMDQPSDIPAKHTAPPSGLFLEQVFYNGDMEKTERHGRSLNRILLFHSHERTSPNRKSRGPMDPAA